MYFSLYLSFYFLCVYELVFAASHRAAITSPCRASWPIHSFCFVTNIFINFIYNFKERIIKQCKLHFSRPTRSIPLNRQQNCRKNHRCVRFSHGTSYTPTTIIIMSCLIRFVENLYYNIKFRFPSTKNDKIFFLFRCCFSRMFFFIFDVESRKSFVAVAVLQETLMKWVFGFLFSPHNLLTFIWI